MVGSVLCWLSLCSTYALDSRHPFYVSWCQGPVENLHYLGFLTRILDLDGHDWGSQEFLEHVVPMAQSCLCRLYTDRRRSICADLSVDRCILASYDDNNKWYIVKAVLD